MVHFMKRVRCAFSCCEAIRYLGNILMTVKPFEVAGLLEFFVVVDHSSQR
jgi:hypothetical protein